MKINNIMPTYRPYRFYSLALSIFLFVAACSSENKTIVQETSSDTSSIPWKVIGPGGGGGVLLPTISPFDENLILTHCDMTGAYLSKDGGENWRMFNLWTVPDDFEFDPVNSNTIYTATRGYRHSEDRGSGLSMLYRSEDQGKRWRIIYPDISKAKNVKDLQNTDLLPSEFIEGSIDGCIDKVKIDPVDNHRIFLGLSPLKSYIGGKGENDLTAMLVMSTDYGKSWKFKHKILGQSVKAIFPGSIHGQPNKVTVFTESACSRIDLISGEVQQLPLPVKKLIVVEGGTDELGSRIYIQSSFSNTNGKAHGGMYVSKDIGKSWTQINKGLFDRVTSGKLPTFRRGLAVCKSQPGVAYISVNIPTAMEDGTPEMQYTILKTENGGENWKPVLRSSSPRGYITDNFEGSWMEQSFDPGWGGSPIHLAVSPGNPNICMAGDNGRGYKTKDGGKTWQQLYSHNQSDGSFASGGLDVTTSYGVHFDPFNKDHFFISYTDMGLFHTFNGGKSWFHALNNIPRPWQNTCYWIEFDPKIKGRVWSVWANAHDLPRDKMFGPRGFERFKGGVARSDDGGKSWQKSNKGIPENSVCTNILIDPDSPLDARIMYVSAFDRGVYKSIDGGFSWNESNSGLGNNRYAWQLRRNTNGRLFVLMTRGKSGNKIVDGVLYFSDDDAKSWSPVQLPHGVKGPHDLLIDPVNTKIMYLSCWPQTLNGKDVHGGVLKTTDGGLTWNQCFRDNYRVNAAGMNPEKPNEIFINTFQNAAFRSDDYGNSWKRIEGYRFKWGQRAIPDINNPGMLFLTTYGGSVFYGPAGGVNNAFEDIENMPKAWW